MDALRGLALLLVLQAAGDGLAHAFRLPVPGPVVGMMLLIAALRVERLRTPVRAIADLLLSHLSLLFVPVGVGVITHLDLLSRSGGPLLVAIVVSTWVGMAVTAVVLKRLLGADEREAPDA
jgi:holin-like protein